VKRILIVDVQPLMREALRLVVNSLWRGGVIVEAGSYAEVEQACGSGQPISLVVMDPALPDAEGLSALVMLKKLQPRLPVVIFSSRRDPQAVASSAILGAIAHVPKSALMSEVAEVLRKAEDGRSLFIEAVPLSGAVDELEQLQRRVRKLSPAQMRVLINVAGGRLNKQVAAEMNVTEATIKAHMTAIFRKLSVANRSQAILAVQPLLRRQLAA
jgi:DNA-binding NarL/FixJ family response regulator